MHCGELAVQAQHVKALGLTTSVDGFRWRTRRHLYEWGFHALDLEKAPCCLFLHELISVSIARRLFETSTPVVPGRSRWKASRG